jgi:hypothetical protein
MSINRPVPAISFDHAGVPDLAGIAESGVTAAIPLAQWQTIRDGPGIAVSKRHGRQRSGVPGSHGIPRCRAPPRSGLRSRKHVRRYDRSRGLSRPALSAAGAFRASERRLFASGGRRRCAGSTPGPGRCCWHMATTGPANRSAGRSLAVDRLRDCWRWFPFHPVWFGRRVAARTFSSRGRHFAEPGIRQPSRAGK